VFLGLGDDELQKIVDLDSCQEYTCQAQEIVFEAGERAGHFYVIEEGEVNLVVGIPADSSHLTKQNVVRTITKGGTFGWSALVPPHVRILSAVSKGPAKVLAIDGRELLTLLDQNPHVGYEVMNSLLRVIVSRFRNIEQLLIAEKGWPISGKPKKA
jgi:CRP-like cAMP-binding protein